MPDNNGEKWCSGGTKEHWVVIDLKELYEIYRFQWFDCGHREIASDNTQYYKIYTNTTLDENDWTLVVDEGKRTENTKNDYIKPVLGRYVKFVPYHPETPITIRIWEFEVYGTRPTLSMGQPADLTMNVDAIKNVYIPYIYLNKGKDFGVTIVSSAKDIVEIQTSTIISEKDGVKFDIKGLKSGTAKLTAKITNNGNSVEKEFQVTVEDGTSSIEENEKAEEMRICQIRHQKARR